MARTSVTYGPFPVWSAKSTSVWVFHPFSPSMDSTRVGDVRASFEMRQDSGNAKIRPAYRLSNDGVTWDSPIAIGGDTLIAEGFHWADAFAALSTLPETKQFIQWGIQCCNETGTDLEICMATLKLDYEEK